MGRSFFRELPDDDSDEDEIIIKLLTNSTSQRKHLWYIDRNHLATHRRLYDDYFAKEPVYPPKLFRRRFRIRRSLFLRILCRVEAYEPYFTQKRNAAKKLGLSPLQKMTTTIRMLAYGVTADFSDEYVRIAESTTMMSLKKFVAAVVAIFSEQYLRSPNNEDIARLLAHGQNRRFPACWEVLIACIGNGKIVQLHGKGCIVVIFVSQVLFWKQWLHMIFGYGTHFLGYLDQTMILTCWSGLMYFLNLHKDVLLQLITQLMVMITQWDIILPMAYIHNGQHL